MPDGGGLSDAGSAEAAPHHSSPVHAEEATLAYFQVLQASLTSYDGRVAEARSLLPAAVEQLRGRPDTRLLVDALLIAGTAARLAGEAEECLATLQEAYALAEAAKLWWQAAVAANYIGSVEYDMGREAEAHRWHKEGLARSCSVGDPRIIAYAVTATSRTARALGQLAELEPLLAEARDSCLKSGDPSTRELCAERLADAAEAAGDPDEALARYAECVALLREDGNAWNLSRVLVAYGYSALRAGGEDLARRCFTEALDIACAAQINLPALDALAGIATLETGRRDGATALALVLRVLQHPAASQDARSRAGQLRARLEARLTPEQIAAVQASILPSPCEGLAAEGLASV